MRLADFLPLLQDPRFDCISLQKGPACAQVAALPPGARLLDLADEIASFDDTAALLHCVDVLLTVDTSVAHLAGALNRPVKVFLPLVPDWRWLSSRLDSPWYPASRLYRQSARGDWRAPLAQAMTDLQDEFCVPGTRSD